ncbi:DUF4386 domain-containing protein [Microbacterium hominis]|uniref:DUF4386 domain-containing protein n=1 Tax=Microbacterium hominis TaxID=162426 RepID=A0A7D4UK05_9MICO|nr:DUF4386 domain-containing protein [Microbacterium hominis]QKJ20147.1 DUF4386 domain-containing protein [Microbacterium hominis]
MNTRLTALAAAAASTPDDTRPARAALWAGGGYAAIFVCAMFGNFAVVQPVLGAGDADAMVTAIAGDPGLYRLAVLAFALIFVVDVIVAWALHVVLSGTGRMRSLLAAWLRLTYTVLLGAGVAFLHLAGQLATGGTAVDAAAAAPLVVVLLEAFDITWIIGLLAFGGHLMVVGTILLRSRIAARPLGIGLIVAGAAYAVDTVAHLIASDYAGIADVMLLIVAIPSIASELGLTVWLFVAARRLRVAAHASEQVATRV